MRLEAVECKICGALKMVRSAIRVVVGVASMKLARSVFRGKGGFIVRLQDAEESKQLMVAALMACDLRNSRQVMM